MSFYERSTKLQLPPQSVKPTRRPHPQTLLPPWLDARFVADASRTALLLIMLAAIATANQLVLAAERTATLAALRRTSLTWAAVTVAVSSMSRLGSTARRCVERVGGTLTGGALGLAAASAEKSFVTAIGAVVAAVVSEAFARGASLDCAAKLTLGTYVIVTFPALLDTPANITHDTRLDAAKFAIARVCAVLMGVGVVAVANVVWFPRAASDDAMDEVVLAGDELSGLAQDVVSPLLTTTGDDDDGDNTSDPAARRDAINTGVRRVRAHRGAVTKALDHARYEAAIARLPTPGACVGACREGGRAPPLKDVETAAPPPPTPRHFAVYLPVPARLLGRTHAGLPVAHVAAVEAATARVAAQLRAVGTAVGSGFEDASLSIVAARYGGRDPMASANPLAALAAGVTAAVDEATAGLAVVRAAWRDGRKRHGATPPAPSYPALKALTAELAWVEDERVRLDAGHRATWAAAVDGARRPAHHEPAVGLARLPPTEAAAREHARWIAFLFELGGTVAAVRELSAAVCALGGAVGAWSGDCGCTHPPLHQPATVRQDDQQDGV